MPDAQTMNFLLMYWLIELDMLLLWYCDLILGNNIESSYCRSNPK